ncbi:4Fe-4S dicluster domain-containing protein [Sporohalobacter salinus]|uniref:4Fe-4S dicluster domain-containing protein n=1 Tax=Sporohalobacter salinus TaxID=1494606 RepID=UPI0019613D50|nr:4Fe-4S dicluster domain-containing protein [Sporohalobacter salinus]MBM7624566.1 ferredoxin hydrogenase large subunit [Sporohalobacter salinus]
MGQDVSEITKLRRTVFNKLSKLAFNGKLREKINNLPKEIIPDEGLNYRCCVHKERAIVNDRIKSALGLPPNGEVENLSQLVDKALTNQQDLSPVVNILEIACDRCPVDKYKVSEACRNCVDHNCMHVCPQEAIIIVGSQAYIDQEKCIECGLCKKACPYNAIVESNRPCVLACETDAIKADNNRQADIDYEHCVSCGNCIQACPFGAITYKAQLIQVIEMLKTKETIAVLAPSFVGQFGLEVTSAQIKKGLKKLNFDQIREVALGADIVAIEEAKEVADKVPDEQDYLTTSCCPAFLTLIKQEYPELLTNVSTTVSPMVAIAKVLKAENPEAKLVFIGPCLAKKGEALGQEEIDAVLTFEELGSLFVGAGINLVDIETNNEFEEASDFGRTFARSGGLVKAVSGSLDQLDSEIEINTIKAEGIAECIKTLKLAKANQYENYFIEGMGCSGGCVGGYGTLMNSDIITEQVNDFGSQAEVETALDNIKAQKLLNELGSKEFHREEE